MAKHQTMGVVAAGEALASEYVPLARYSRGAIEASLELALERIKVPDPTVLDVGAGTGWPGAVLKELAPSCQLVGVDPSRAMLDECRTRGVYDGLVCASADSLPVASSSVDLVFCIEALHLLPRQGRECP